MKKMVIQSWLTFIALLIFSSTTFAGEMEERNKLKTEVTYNLQTNNFARLEALGNTLMNPKERFPSGVWKLYWFSNAITNYMGKDLSPAYWIDLEQKAKAWIKKYPNSSTAKIFFAKTYLQHAWAYRGNGFAGDVSDEDWDNVGKYANLSYKVLIENSSAKANPDWYPTMFDVLALRKNNHQEFTNLISEGTKRHPSYHDIYFTASWYLTPIWGNSEEAIDSLALFSQKNATATEGSSMYARIYWSVNQSYYKGKIFENSKASWKIMKPSFDDLISRYPASWNINAYAYFSCIAKDRNTLKVLLKKIGDNIDLGAWGSNENNRYMYLNCVKFSEETTPNTIPNETKREKNPSRNKTGPSLNRGAGLSL